MRNNSRKNYRRRNTGASQIKLVGIVAVIVVIAIIIVISCFNKTKKDSNKAKDTGTATENVTGVTEQVSGLYAADCRTKGLKSGGGIGGDES